MIDIQRQPVHIEPRAFIEHLIAEHGLWRVLCDVAAAVVRPGRPASLSPEQLSGHLQRDIGCERPPPSPRHWDIRF